jgi:pimeloyl-ACP methyl ester carboxylesterase
VKHKMLVRVWWLVAMMRPPRRGTSGWQQAALVALTLTWFFAGAMPAQAGLEVPFAPFYLNPLPVGLTKPDAERIQQEQTAVIAIHGLASDQDKWEPLDDVLVKGRSFKMYTFSYSTYLGIDENAQYLASDIERYSQSGGELAGHDVVIVGHSMGGLVARGYIEKHGGKDRLLRLVTLGTPNDGTPLADLAWMARPELNLIDDKCKGTASGWFTAFLLAHGILPTDQGVKDLQPDDLDGRSPTGNTGYAEVLNRDLSNAPLDRYAVFGSDAADAPIPFVGCLYNVLANIYGPIEPCIKN